MRFFRPKLYRKDGLESTNTQLETYKSMQTNSLLFQVQTKVQIIKKNAPELSLQG